MAHTYTNELIHENSPYLLQHAHNPVNWHAWNEAALEKSKKEDKPILVSIGYAACHWCHVMERESFENVEVADYMNEHFINIKIDREERPDLDHIYMDAVQAIAGNGGWPLNVFLTTDAKPFYGGTYFPPEKAFNRPSWKEILFFINDAWQKRRNEIEQQAETLLAHINSSTDFISNKKLEFSSGNNSFFTAEHCKIINDNILKSADILNGGFGNAPKFPQTFVIQYLLNYGYHFRHEKSLKHAMFSLRQMLQGGIYDQLAGGLARYSTDDKWLVPHFEKMLYDNALLVSVLCDAYQINGDILYKNGIEKTLDFFIKEMKDPEGGFYAALDADSEGVEGKFYVWDKNEIDNILGGDSKIFSSFYGITAGGNWEHKNILHIVESAEKFSSENNMTAGDFDELLQSLEKKLLAERNKRTRPATDDKILLGWNALLLTAFCKASAALGNETYRSEAISLFDFLKTKFSKAGEICYHVYKNDLAKHAAYLDDYACLIQASLLLQELTGSQEYLNFAKQLTDYVIKHFLDKEKGFFYYTGDHQQDVITRKVEIYDSATPSGNSVMAQNLFYLSIVFDKREWWNIAQNMLIGISEIILKHPTSFAVWSALVVNQVTGIHEIVITGGHSEAVLKDLLGIYLPGKVLQSAGKESGLPLLINKMYNEFPLIYLCKNYVCSAPVLTIEEFRKQIEFTLK